MKEWDCTLRRTRAKHLMDEKVGELLNVRNYIGYISTLVMVERAVMVMQLKRDMPRETKGYIE